MAEAGRLGIVLVVCAPSGAGKSTLVRRLLAEFPNLRFSVSCTTRPPRAGEVEGRDYRFLERAAFESLRGAGHFAEWAEVHGNLYGTPKEPVEEALARGRDVLFDIDVQGARQLRASFPDGVFVFVLPPSIAELSRRLKGRGTDAPEVVERRLGNALRELAAAPEFGFWVVNDDLDTAYGELRAVYLAGRARPACRPGLLAAVLAGRKAGA